MKIQGMVIGVVVMLLALFLSFTLGRCQTTSNAERGSPVVESVDLLDVRVDTVTRVVERQPVRVYFDGGASPIGDEVATVDTVWVTLDSTRLDTVGVEQEFASAIDTIVGKDTIRVKDSLWIRARDGPIEIVSLKSLIEVMSPPDSLLDTRTQIILKETSYRNRPWLETVGIASLGAVGGTVVYIIVKELVKRE
ncbi:MAG: hypothetical protein KDD67_13790 [Ignavibacteriae bacterium]|nr:hypothetical protein [Ignavibacteriota bacterium]MCB9216141.1 hypothetical protein [Ignavibacteria bacterium]